MTGEISPDSIRTFVELRTVSTTAGTTAADDEARKGQNTATDKDFVIAGSGSGVISPPATCVGTDRLVSTNW